MVRIDLETSDGKPLRSFVAGGTKRRDDGFDPAILRGGVDPPHATDGIRRDPARRGPERACDGVGTRFETARVMLFAGQDLQTDDDAMVASVSVRQSFVNRPLERASRQASLAFSTASR